MVKKQSLRNIWRMLGPGLMYAAAAVGVSHLVQSTRAGGDFGLFFIPIIFLANFLKWPFFEAGPRYAHYSGKSLISAYAQEGKWAIILYIVILIGSMFAVLAAITTVTAGLFENLFHTGLGILPLAICIIGICCIILLWGKYRLLDRTVKYIVVVLTVTTVLALLFGLKKGLPHWGETQFDWQQPAHIFFFVALLGWMPAPIDISIWQSAWVLEKKKDESNSSYRVASLDFHIGYWGTTILAVIFLLLGALFLYGNQDIPQGSVAFAERLTAMYAESLGSFGYWIVSIAAVSCMFSTTITVLDAYPRVWQLIFALRTEKKQKNVYKPVLLIYVIGAMLIIAFFSDNMVKLVEVATVIAFLSAPILAWLNMRAVSKLPKEGRFSPFIQTLSWVGLVFLVAFSVYYIWLRM